MKNHYTMILVAGLLWSCGRKQDSSGGASGHVDRYSQSTQEINGNIKDAIFRKRTNSGALKAELYLNVAGPVPGHFIANDEALNAIALHVFGSGITLSLDEQKTAGAVDIRTALPSRMKAMTQAYIQLLRQKFYPKCQTMVQNELTWLDGNSANKRLLVEARNNLSAEKINSFMEHVFRAKAPAGQMHEGAYLYATTFNDIIATNASESRQNIYAVICLSIVTDPRTYLR